MSKKNIFLFALLFILAGVYVVYFTDLFNKPEIRISARPRIDRPRQGPERYSVSFSFDTKAELTEIKVISVAEAQTNKYPHAVWHLISDTNSAPVKGLVYGDPIKGMKPKVPKMKAEPLKAGEKYRLIVQAGKMSGQVEFATPAGRRASQ